MACIAPPTAAVDVYDPSKGTFQRNGSLAQPRSNPTALLLKDGRVLVVGGTDKDGAFLKTIEIYSATQGKSAVFTLPAGKQLGERAIVLLADGRVLFAGGTVDWSAVSGTTLIFDPSSGLFSDGPSMTTPRSGAKAAPLPDGRVLVAGGTGLADPGGWYEVKSAEVIDPANASSRRIVEIPNVVASATSLGDGRVLLEEWDPTPNPSGCIAGAAPEVFDSETLALTPVSPMATPRIDGARIRTRDGRVLFLSGRDTTCELVTTVDAFDPATGTFRTILQGFPKVSGFSATLLADGRILIAGGELDITGITAKTWILVP